ncbi:MAG: hypothetical protein K6B64_01705, partial [Acholeplasmatales bacterium]|nr:hypothetical protein [Acholeplasmatales bacterium]
MILDGDIINYFNEINTEVELSEYENTTSFIFSIDYLQFSAKASISINHDINLLSFQLIFEHPQELDNMPQGLNILNQNSTMLKAYYDKLEDAVFIKANHFVNEENIISTISFIIESATNIDSEYIENLYNTIYDNDYDLFDDEFNKAHENTSI